METLQLTNIRLCTRIYRTVVFPVHLHSNKFYEYANSKKDQKIYISTNSSMASVISNLMGPVA